MKLTALLVAMLALLCSACNTMEGLGKDIERGGEKVQNSAEKNK